MKPFIMAFALGVLPAILHWLSNSSWDRGPGLAALFALTLLMTFLGYAWGKALAETEKTE